MGIRGGAMLISNHTGFLDPVYLMTGILYLALILLAMDLAALVGLKEIITEDPAMTYINSGLYVLYSWRGISLLISAARISILEPTHPALHVSSATISRPVFVAEAMESS